MDYKIIHEVSTGELIVAVNENIEKGWEPVGGVTWESGGFEALDRYLQAMVRRPKPLFHEKKQSRRVFFNRPVAKRLLHRPLPRR